MSNDSFHVAGSYFTHWVSSHDITSCAISFASNVVLSLYAS